MPVMAVAEDSVSANERSLMLSSSSGTLIPLLLASSPLRSMCATKSSLCWWLPLASGGVSKHSWTSCWVRPKWTERRWVTLLGSTC